MAYKTLFKKEGFLFDLDTREREITKEETVSVVFDLKP